MPLNDDTDDEFASRLEDETVYPRQPTYADGTTKVLHDYGSGSYAEDGPLEVAEDLVMMNGEGDSMVGGYQIGAGHVPTELLKASGLYPVDGASEIGHGGIAHGLASEEGQSEIGHGMAHGLASEEGQSEIGYGPYSEEGATEVGRDGVYRGHAPSDGQSEIGHQGLYPVDGASELGAAGDIEPGTTPFDLFMEGSTRMGSAAMYGPTEIGSGWYAQEGASEIGAAVAKVVERARNSRQPAPPMKAVHVDEPTDWGEDWGVSDFIVGAAEATGGDQFPLLSKMLLAAGAAIEPRYVRVDTEGSYQAFRAEHSPEMAELQEKMERLQAKVDEHITDPYAHEGIPDDLTDDVDELVHLGAEADHAEAEKRIDLVMPKHFDGLITAWHQGDFVCASMQLPGQDGEVRICTSFEPIRKCVEEMSRHAAESGAPASAVIGVLPAMGCVLGAGTALKEMAAAAPAILQRPEAVHKAPFTVRIEPKANPTLTALAMLVMACRGGDAQACSEWQRLGDTCPGPVKQAMVEALQLAKAA